MQSRPGRAFVLIQLAAPVDNLRVDRLRGHLPRHQFPRPGLEPYVPAARLRHAAEGVHRLRGDARGRRAGRRHLRRRAARRPEHPPARGRDPRGPAPPQGAAVTCRWRCSSVTCRATSTPTSAGQDGRRGDAQGSRPWPRYATDYRALVETCEGARLAGGCRQRAAAASLGGGQERAGGARVSSRRTSAARRARPAVPARRLLRALRGDDERRTRRPATRSLSRRAGGDDRALLLVAVREGRDDGRGDRVAAVDARRRPVVHVQRRLPQRLRPRHRRTRPPPPRRQAHRRDLRRSCR